MNPFSAWAAKTADAYHAMGLNYVDCQNSFNPDGTPKLLYPANFGFGSRHPGGAMFAYANGRACDDAKRIVPKFATSAYHRAARVGPRVQRPG